MKNSIPLILLAFFIPFVLISQIQIGINLYGDFEGARFGGSVSISSDGQRIAVGAKASGWYDQGYVRVYEMIDSVWVQLGNDIAGAPSDALVGIAVSLSADGNRVAFGSNLFDGEYREGKVTVYEYYEGTWERRGNAIIGETDNDFFGSALSLSDNGKIVAIGASANSNAGSYAGQVKIFEYFDEFWKQIGSSIEGKVAHEQFGKVVSLSGDGHRVAIGAPYYEDTTGNGFSNLGEVRIYDYKDGEWTPVGENKIIGKEEYDNLGRSVALSSDGKRVAVGAPYHSYFDFDTGYVQIYEISDSQWNQVGTDLLGMGGVRDAFGSSVSLSNDGMRLAIAAPYVINPSEGAQVVLHEYIRDEWKQLGNRIHGEDVQDWYGNSIAISGDGDYLVVGSQNTDLSGLENVGLVQVFSYVGVPLNIAELGIMEIDVVVFPNPTTGIISISGSEIADMEILIADSRGEVIEKSEVEWSTNKS